MQHASEGTSARTSFKDWRSCNRSETASRTAARQAKTRQVYYAHTHKGGSPGEGSSARRRRRLADATRHLTSANRRPDETINSCQRQTETGRQTTPQCSLSTQTPRLHKYVTKCPLRVTCVCNSYIPTGMYTKQDGSYNVCQRRPFCHILTKWLHM